VVQLESLRTLLEIRDLRVSFQTNGETVRAVDGVSLRIPAGKTVALVGESGCGKSATALSVLRLLPQPPAGIDGQLLFTDPRSDWPVDLLRLPVRELRHVRGNRIAMIFQEPMSSLNPVITIGRQIAEVLEHHRRVGLRAAWSRAVELLDMVGIPAPRERAYEYPHRLSGGMLQRVMIAMALACEPCVLIADEPTTALDVTVQQQILELLQSAQVRSGMSVLLITHDLGVVAQLADEVYVMYAGTIVEHAPASRLLQSPLHPYTRGLLAATPRITESRGRLVAIPGVVPAPPNLPTGCRFHPRCSLSPERARQPGRFVVKAASEFGGFVLHRCVEQIDAEESGPPPLREARPGHFVACWEAK